MRRVLTTVLAVAVLLGLGALAVLALPNGGAPLAGAPAVSAAAPEFQDAPEATLATNKYNMIAMPLNAANQFTSAGQSFNAAGMAAIVGSGVQQVLSWNPNTSSYLSYVPGLGGDNFNLAVGGAYWLELDSTAGSIVSFVGDVPAQGTIKNTLVRPASGNCVYNDISIPLDQSSVTTPQQLADAIGNVEQVLQWNATTQSFLQFVPGLGGDTFNVKIGYPYTVCLQPGSSTTWPQ